MIRQCLFLQLGTGEKTSNHQLFCYRHNTIAKNNETFHHRKKRIEIENSFFFAFVAFLFLSEREINGIGALIHEKKKIVNMKLIVFTNRYLKIDGFLEPQKFLLGFKFLSSTTRKKVNFFICVAFPLLNYWKLYGTSEGVGVLGRLFFSLACFIFSLQSHQLHKTCASHSPLFFFLKWNSCVMSSVGGFA